MGILGKYCVISMLLSFKPPCLKLVHPNILVPIPNLIFVSLPDIVIYKILGFHLQFLALSCPNPWNFINLGSTRSVFYYVNEGDFWTPAKVGSWLPGDATTWLKIWNFQSPSPIPHPAHPYPDRLPPGRKEWLDIKFTC